MGVRAVASTTISFGPVVIPIKVYTAASSRRVNFHHVHASCGSRVKQQLYCPVEDTVVGREELVRAVEYEKNRHVTFSSDELGRLEGESAHTVKLLEFVPLETVDYVQVEKSAYLGPADGGRKGYHLLRRGLERAGRIAVGQLHARGRDRLVWVRAYRDGLVLHYVYYGDELRSFEAIDRGGAVALQQREDDLADQLIARSSVDTYEPGKFQDAYRARLLAAVEQKTLGREGARRPSPGEVTSVFDGLKASLPTEGGEPLRTRAAVVEPEAKNSRSRSGSGQ